MAIQGQDFPTREWSFRVEGVTAPGEIMCVVGSCVELGEWKPEKIVPMQIITSDPSLIVPSSAPASASAEVHPSNFRIRREDHEMFSASSTCENNRNSR